MNEIVDAIIRNLPLTDYVDALFLYYAMERELHIGPKTRVVEVPVIPEFVTESGYRAKMREYLYTYGGNTYGMFLAKEVVTDTLYWGVG